MSTRYIPGAGDLIKIPTQQPGHACGHRLAVVLSPQAYNKKTGLLLCSPVTTHIKGYPFEVLLDTAHDRAALADQMASVTWAGTRIERQGRVDSPALDEIRAKLATLIFKT